MLEKTLESPLERKEIKPVNLKGNQSWLLFGRTDAEVEAPMLWPPDVNCWLVGKDSDARKDWRQKEKRATKDEMVGRHHWFNGHELGQILGNAEGQGSLECCSPWGHKELDTTWRLNNSKDISMFKFLKNLHSFPQSDPLKIRSAPSQSLPTPTNKIQDPCHHLKDPIWSDLLSYHLPYCSLCSGPTGLLPFLEQTKWDSS